MLRVKRSSLPSYELKSAYAKRFNKAPPRGLSYALSFGKLSREESEAMLIKAVETGIEITGYDLLPSGDPGIV